MFKQFIIPEHGPFRDICIKQPILYCYRNLIFNEFRQDNYQQASSTVSCYDAHITTYTWAVLRVMRMIFFWAAQKGQERKVVVEAGGGEPRYTVGPSSVESAPL
jgi:hypothetical protein